MTGRQWFDLEMAHLTGPDEGSRAAVRRRADDILRPAGALQRFDDVAVWVAGWQHSVAPSVHQPVGIVFAADHGVAVNGVSKYPIEVTKAMLDAFATHRSTITSMARIAGAELRVVDVGVGRPSGDLRTERAVDEHRFDECVDAARQAVESVDADLLVFGEMGIGNTTAAAAVAHALGGGEAEEWVGRGTGVDDDALARKIEAVRSAVARSRGLDPLSTLSEIGGLELVAIAAAIVAARRRSIPVILDGYVVTAAAAVLHAIRSDALDHCIAGHCSAEPGHRRLLRLIGMSPLLDLDMRLGEASGAMAAVPLVKMACASVTEVPTFTEFFGPPE
ncbi:MAG: nicotinate-nucleotide--dimethylbenzimidazole phosphoribosyltransferase [Actinomycetota bacterium]|nr:nicotinate-nucleotide--dimethylbenzimidazole phosphoribosyltransferase [Actinomycetota bacterium]MDA2972855.1 nicotinate-nucleotide--dimethylbenzimidazole phosphoribosyltransferase [Actinomycetota bacterium]MDA3002166.1 nicotinate-nucleotide--dimethylbenzimidazole phosphoribosyltransferase [Actinomycetota bacterium]